MTVCEIMLHYRLLYSILLVYIFKGECLLGELVSDGSILNGDELHLLRCISYCLSAGSISVDGCREECSRKAAHISVNFSSVSDYDFDYDSSVNQASSSNNRNCESLELSRPSSAMQSPQSVELNWQFNNNNGTCESLIFIIQQRLLKKDETTEDWMTIPDLIIVDSMQHILRKLDECLYSIRVVAVSKLGIQAISNTVNYTAYPVPVNPSVIFSTDETHLDATINLTPHTGWENTLNYWNVKIDHDGNVPTHPQAPKIPKIITRLTNQTTVWLGFTEDLIGQSLIFTFEPISGCSVQQTLEKVVKVEYGNSGLTRPSKTIETAYDMSLLPNEIQIQQYPGRNATISVYIVWTKWKERVTYKPEEITSYNLHWGNITTGILLLMPEMTTIGELQLPPTQFNITLHGFLPNTQYGIQVIARSRKTDQLNYKFYNVRDFTTIDAPLPTLMSKVNQTYATLQQQLTLSRRSFSSEPTSSNLTQVVIPVTFLGALLLVAVGVCCRYLIMYRSNHKSLLPGEEMVLNLYETYAQNQTIRQQQSPAAPDRWELPSSCLKFQDVLGEGAFGQVTKAVVERCWLRNSHVAKGGSNGTIVVAVKALHGFADSDERQNFLREIDLMKVLGHHPNVVSLLACSTREQPVCLVVEHCEHGDLLSYLRSHRKKETQTDGVNNNNMSQLTPKDLLSFARQVAVGMEYLSQKGFIHRDLAARNILVADNKIAKIGDFGLTRYVYDDKIYLNRKGGKLPIKWMSIEAIFDHMFTSKSDIWSYGVLIAEIVTMGCTPYPGIHNRELLKLLQQGYRMERPDNCSHELYSIMLSCWNDKSDDRPTFTDIRYHLEDMLEQGTPYVDVSIDPYRDCFYHSTSSSSSSDSIEERNQNSETGALMPKVPTVKGSLTLKVPTEKELLEKKLQCLTRRSDPQCLTRGSNPQCLTRGSDPQCLTRGSDQQCLTRGSDPQYLTRGSDPHLSVSKNYSADSGVISDEFCNDFTIMSNSTQQSLV